MIALVMLAAVLGTALPTLTAPAMKTLVIAQGGEPTSLEPHNTTDIGSGMIRTSMYNNLVVWDKKMTKIEPELAVSWEVARGGTVWEFKLRRDVKFHDGTTFNAFAVKASFDRLLDPKRSTTAAQPEQGHIKSVEVVDPYTVRLITAEPFGPMLQHLASSSGAIPSPAAARKWGDDLTLHPTGTGPFRFVEWIKGDRIVMERNPTYFKGAPQVDRLIYRIVPEAATRVAMLETGEADVALGLSVTDAERLRNHAQVGVMQDIQSRSVTFWINADRKPFDDRRVRRALNHAVNREEIIRFVMRGIASKPACSYFPPGVFGYDATAATCYNYSPDRARQLLAEAGVSAGTEVTLSTPVGRYLMDKEITEAVASQLRNNVGLNTRVQTVGDFPTYLTRVLAEPTMNLGFCSLISPPQDGHFMTSVYFGSDRAGKPHNWSRTRNSRVDELIRVGRTNTDLRIRQQAYAEVQKITSEEAYWLMLWNEVALTGARKTVRGVVLMPSGYLNVRDASKQ
ncbi:MAG: hypothetical protein HY660_08660 [Armatimonadetes bacterium]|nr:hypothetical protein [Armatimonadota bacterium]